MTEMYLRDSPRGNDINTSFSGEIPDILKGCSHICRALLHCALLYVHVFALLHKIYNSMYFNGGTAIKIELLYIKQQQAEQQRPK